MTVFIKKMIWPVLLVLCMQLPLAAQFVLPGKPGAQLAALERLAPLVKRPANLTVQYLWDGYGQEDDFYRLITDRAYVNSLSEEELNQLLELAVAWPFGAVEAERTVGFLIKELSVLYQPEAAHFNQTQRYSMLAGTLCYNTMAGRGQLSRLLSALTNLNAGNPAQKIWFSEALANIPSVLPGQERIYIQFLERSIESLDYLAGLPAGLSPAEEPVTNQRVSEEMVAYMDSFFAHKESDSVWKTFISTGAFSPHEFYFQRPVPGKGWLGGFVDTPSGQRHQLADNLIIALMSHYGMHKDWQAVERFIHKYSSVNSQGQFKHYLLFGINGLKAARHLLDTESLAGWDAQYQGYVHQIAAQIYQHNPGLREGTWTQGAAEVACEWIMMGKAITCVFKGVATVGVKAGLDKPLKWGAKMTREALSGVGNGVFNVLPVRVAGNSILLREVARKTPSVWKKNLMGKLAAKRSAANAALPY